MGRRVREGSVAAALSHNAITGQLNAFGSPPFRSQPGEDGCVTHILGRPSALKSLRGRLRRGEALARLYEEHLFQLMVFGEAGLPSYQKLKKAKDEFGGRGR